MGEAIQIDWNAAIHLLDELSDGMHSFLEINYMAPHYNQGAFLAALLFLADRRLIELSKGRVNPEMIPAHEWTDLLNHAFGSCAPEPDVMSQTAIELSDKGEQLLRLLNMGHPPLSR